MQFVTWILKRLVKGDLGTQQLIVDATSAHLDAEYQLHRLEHSDEIVEKRLQQELSELSARIAESKKKIQDAGFDPDTFSKTL